MTEQGERFPIKHVLGLLLSSILTLLAAWAALRSNLPTTGIIWIIMALAAIQAAIQLFMFMHMVEFKSGLGHVPWNMIFHGLVLAAIIVAGSLFTMYSGHGSGGHGGEGGHNQHKSHKAHGKMK